MYLLIILNYTKVTEEEVCHNQSIYLKKRFNQILFNLLYYSFLRESFTSHMWLTISDIVIIVMEAHYQNFYLIYFSLKFIMLISLIENHPEVPHCLHKYRGRANRVIYHRCYST